MIAALQRLLAEQNHLLQEHRQQLAALVERASRPAPANAASAPAEATTTVAVEPAPSKLSMGPTMQQTRSTVTAAPWSMSTAAQRPLHSTQAIVESPGFWSRLGRGFVNTFSLAYKD
jgi:hypothetical protein